jgi:flagellar hook assembly protein FlgD
VVTRLEQNTPNPFNPATQIHYTVGHESPVTLVIYDVQGRLVRTLVRATQPGGRYHAVWDGRNERGTHVPSGIYVYRLTTGSVKHMRKLVLVR